MCFNHASHLWPNPQENFFSTREFTPQKQTGPTCVATTLSVLTNQPVAAVQAFGINTQDPVSWSAHLSNHGMKLAYCPTDVRKLRFYMDELISFNDLFLISYYSLHSNAGQILGDPDENGFLTGSHIVTLHRNMILDTASGDRTLASDHDCNYAHTKRIFRVVPISHARGL